MRIGMRHGASVLVAWTFLSVVGCGDDMTTQPTGSSAVEGHVAGDDGSGRMIAIEGATVVLAQVQTDGSLETVSSGAVTTDVTGAFDVRTSLDRVRNLVVVATKNDSEWSAVVSAEVRHGASVTAPPLDEESTVEAEVHAEIVASGSASSVSFTDLAAYVTAELSAQVHGNATAIAELANAIEAEATARASVLTAAEIGATGAQLAAIQTAKTQAQVTLDAGLEAAAGNLEMMDAALAGHHQALISAYVEAGVTASAYAKALETSARALVDASAQLETGARMAISRQAAELRARAIDASVQAQLTAIGASQSVKNQVTTATADLLVAIEVSSNTGAIVSAFDTHHDSLVAELSTALSARAAAIASVDASINGLAGAKANLVAGISAAVSTEALVTAYLTFYTAVRGEVEAALSTATAAEVAATTEVLIAANMFS